MTKTWGQLVLRLVFAAALFGTVFFAKAWVVRAFGSDVPNWDQWDAEAAYLLLPWRQHQLKPVDLFQAHNEHRIALTKASTLGLVYLNGQWDARLQTVFNAVLHSVLAVLLWFWLRPLLGRGPTWAWTLGILATLAPPHAWQNVLGGFHSQQYYLLLLSLVGLDRALRCSPLSGGWWLGMLCLGLSLFSMGSGFMAAAVVLPMLLFQNGGQVRALRKELPTLLVCGAWVVAGVLLRVEIPGHQSLKAQSFHDFYQSLRLALQWPVTHPYLQVFALIAYLPWLLLTMRVWRRRDRIDSREPVIVAAGAWVLLQFLATAYARGAGGAPPASRYYDTETLSVLINFAALLVLVSREPWSPPWRPLRRWAFALWCFGAGYGLLSHGEGVLRGDMTVVGPQFYSYTEHLRAYVATDDPTDLVEGEIPYPSADTLRERVSHPEIRALLPAGVRPPLALTPARSDQFSQGGVAPEIGVPRGLTIWGSYSTERGGGAVGDWQSEPVTPPPEGYLLFHRAGSREPGALRIELWSADLSRRLANVGPAAPSPHPWSTACVPTPREPFRVVAHDASSTGWLAFSGPVPMATGSYWSRQVTESSPRGFWISLALLCGLLPWMSVQGRAASRGSAWARGQPRGVEPTP